MLQAAWKERVISLNLGSVQFRRDNTDGIGYHALSIYPLYRSLANKGLLTLGNERDLTGKFTGWDDFFSLTQVGVQRIATVALTPDGAKLGAVHRFDKSEREYVVFVVGGHRIEKIVSNEAIDVTGDKYRIVLGTKAFEVRPEFRDAMAAAGESTVRDLRFRALLKYDAFESKWKVQTWDVGPRDVDFRSQSVPTTMARLRTGAR